MATSQSTADYILQQLVALEQVAVRKMFGEYALYFRGKVVALICDDLLFVKITDDGRKFVGKFYEEGYPYPGAKAHILIEEDLLSQREWLCELIRITEKVLPFPPPKKNKRHVLKEPKIV